MKIRYIIMAALAAITCFGTAACNKRECVHEYEAVHKTAATCTKSGAIVYLCKDCGKEKQREIPAKGHTPGAEPTLTKEQICSVCKTALKPAATYMPYYAKDIPLNHYYGAATNFYRTETRTQYKQAYAENKQYVTEDGETETLGLEFPLQDFYKHEILSPMPLKSVNGKEYQSEFGFKVGFTMTMAQETEKYQSWGAWESGLKNQVNAEALRTVYAYPAANIFYNEVSVLIDLSKSYLELAKETSEGYQVLATLSGLEDWETALEKGEIALAGEKGALFQEEGKYRVLFKYELLWAATPAQAVLESGANASSKAVYPYGFVNPQYDFFYVEVTSENGNILLPSNTDEVSKGTFCQVRGLTPSDQGGFLAEGATLNFDTVVQLAIKAKADMSADGFFYEGKKLTSFSAVLSYYDEDTEKYQLEISYDLLDKITEEIAMGKEILLDVGKSVRLRNAPCRMTVSYTAGEGEEKIIGRQIYNFTMNW